MNAEQCFIAAAEAKLALERGTVYNADVRAVLTEFVTAATAISRSMRRFETHDSFELALVAITRAVFEHVSLSYGAP